MFAGLTAGWYTDSATIKRTEEYKDGNITKHRRDVVIAENVPCRVYKSNPANAVMRDTAAELSSNDILACDNSADIKAGDEILVTRGGMLGHTGNPIRYFAGDPEQYYEPFGGAVPNISHQQVPLSGERRIS
jgi:hypothetical protein